MKDKDGSSRTHGRVRARRPVLRSCADRFVYALRRILNANPFDALAGIPYRYFFSGSYILAMKPGEEMFNFKILIEQGTTAKTFEFSGPKALLANLLWFAELISVEEISGLKRLD